MCARRKRRRTHAAHMTVWTAVTTHVEMALDGAKTAMPTVVTMITVMGSASRSLPGNAPPNQSFLSKSFILASQTK